MRTVCLIANGVAFGGVVGMTERFRRSQHNGLTNVPRGPRLGAGAGRFGRTRALVAVVALVASTLVLAAGAPPAAAAVVTRAYVANNDSGTVSVIDTATNTVVATIPVGFGPQGVAVTPDGTRIYVTKPGSDNVSVIDTATNTVVATIPVGFAARGVAVTPDGTRAYVAVASTVSVIDTATNTVVTTIPVGGDLAVNPDGTRVYVTNFGLDTVSVINTATNTVVATIPVGLDPSGVAVSPDGTRAYVTNQSSDTVSVIDTATNTVVATIPVGDAPVGVAVNPDDTRAYVTNQFSDNVSVIDTATNTVVTTIPVGFGPFGVAVNPDGTRAYVTNRFADNVSVIDTATNTVVTTIPVGLGPHGVAIAAVLLENTPPSCALTAVIAGPPKQIHITVQDTGSGLASIDVLQSTNANTVVPGFAVGTTDPVVVTATKVNQAAPSQVMLRITDLAGNVIDCDPVLTVVARERGQPATETYRGLPAAEHFVTVINDDPGLTALQVEVNGKTFTVAGLKAGETRTLDVASAMVAGSDNTFSLTPVGKPGTTATVLIHD